MRRLTYSDILDSEIKTIIFTKSFLKGADENIPKILDILIQLSYFTGPNKDINTPEGEYHSLCWHLYLQTPYSFRACFILYEFGHYLEATFILRHLIENLIKMRYLFNHRSFSTKVWVGKNIEISKKGKKKKLSLRDMSEEVSPGFYDINYGRLLSGFQHGGIGTSLFRIKRRTPTEGKIRMGSTWDEFGATFVINHIIALCYGYLNYFPKFFPEGFSNIETELSLSYKKYMDWLEKAMESHRKVNPKSISWYKEIDTLIK